MKFMKEIPPQYVAAFWLSKSFYTKNKLNFKIELTTSV